MAASQNSMVRRSYDSSFAAWSATRSPMRSMNSPNDRSRRSASVAAARPPWVRSIIARKSSAFVAKLE